MLAKARSGQLESRTRSDKYASGLDGTPEESFPSGTMSREKPIEPPKGCPHQDLFARVEIVTRVAWHRGTRAVEYLLGGKHVDRSF